VQSYLNLFEIVVYSTGGGMMEQEQILKEWRDTDHSKLTHFFGEMDLDLTKPKDEIYTVAFHIAESCGYFVSQWENFIELNGREGEYFRIVFDGDKATAILIGKEVKVISLEDIPEYQGYKNGWW
jgi:hypothetical protein